MIDVLRSVIPSARVNEPMSKHTTFKVGGPADIFVQPTTEEEMQSVLKACAQYSYPHFILGNGSNLLVRDGGVRGVVVSMMQMRQLRLIGSDKILAGAGVMMRDLAEFAAAHGLGGMEFLHGIPGSVGGGVYMNAGAYEGEMGDVFVSARCTNKEGNFVDMDSKSMDFAYRRSAAQINGYAILSAILQGKPKDIAEINEELERLRHMRSSKQPLEKPSAGSTFKRPPGKFAGKLIADAGLRGHIIGGAQVSEKHSGFIINRGHATATDILRLISHIQYTVQEKFGVRLETEVKIIGED